MPYSMRCIVLCKRWLRVRFDSNQMEFIICASCDMSSLHMRRATKSQFSRWRMDFPFAAFDGKYDENRKWNFVRSTFGGRHLRNGSSSSAIHVVYRCCLRANWAIFYFHFADTTLMLFIFARKIIGCDQIARTLRRKLIGRNHAIGHAIFIGSSRW